MAKSAYILLVGLGLVAGCQDTGTGVSAMPEPNFSAPVIARQQPSPARVAVRPIQPSPAAPVKQKPPVVVSSAVAPREWIPNAPARPWRYIVIHHSDTPDGNAAKFDAAHRAKGWDELGYHFVIDNGVGGGDGQVEVGPRWPKQKWGAHAKTPDNRYNDYGIGICLVGNFDETRPTSNQMKSVAKLTAYLMKTYHITPNNIVGHGDTKATDCPGRNMSVATVRRMATAMAADSSWTPDAATIAAGEEMLKANGQ